MPEEFFIALGIANVPLIIVTVVNYMEYKKSMYRNFSYYLENCESDIPAFCVGVVLLEIAISFIVFSIKLIL